MHDEQKILTPHNPFTAEHPPLGLICDVDGTLTESKSPMDTSMADAICSWISTGRKFAAITGGKLEQLEEQFISKLSCSSELLQHIQLFPASGSAMFVWDQATNSWSKVYDHAFSSDEKALIYQALEQARQQPQLAIPDPKTVHGPQIEDRGGQITLSALGQQAPWTEKKDWDPDKKKRMEIVAFITPLLPDFDVKYGGSTSIDITKPGINKAHGVKEWWSHLSLDPKETLFIGDRLEPKGNDHIVLTTGIAAHQVAGPDETENLIRKFINN